MSNHVGRRIRLRKGSANFAKVRMHAMATAQEMLRIEGEWERQIRADERLWLAKSWRNEAHSVMFNHDRDDLTPAQRVGKWLEAQS